MFLKAVIKMYDKQIMKIIDKLKIFEKMYEQIRLVDPIMKKANKF